MSKNCGNCGNDSFASSNEGSVVCTACGTVKESANIVSEVQFGGDSSIVGTFVSATRKPSSYRSLGGRDSRAMSVENARKKLDQIGNSLRIRSHLIDSAQRTFELAMENNFTKGRQTRLVAAACLYIVCRRERTPHLLIDFSENLQVNVFIVAGTFLQLIKLLNIQLPIVDPSFFIQRFASALEFGDQTKDVIATANKLVARMKRDWMSIGRKPSGICGASLYIASKIHGFKRSMKEIVHVVKIGEQTLINRLDEFRKTPTATLRFDEFNGMDLEDQCDPPSFTRARLKEKKEEEKLKLLEEKKERKRLKKEKKKLLELENNKDNKEIIIKENKEEIEKKLEKKQDLKKDKKDKIKGGEGEEEEEEEEDDDDDDEEEEEDNLNEETKGDNKKNKKRKRELLKDDDDIEKESNDIVKGSQNVQSIKDITNVDSIPTTLLENIEKFEKIQSDIKTLAQKVKNEMDEKIKESQSQEPDTTPPPSSTTTTQTTTTTTTSQNNESSAPIDLPTPINKTMDSVVSYPTITSTIDQSVFAPNDELENLSDEELDFYLEHDKDTVKKKEEIWVELNKEWIEKNEERQREIEEDIKAGRPPRKRKAPVSKKSAENAQAAAEEELKKRTRNAKLVEKLGLFKPNFVTMGLFGGAGASNNQAAVGAMLSTDGTSKNTSINPKETNKEDDDDDDYEPIQPIQSGSLLSRNFNNYEEDDY
ncbi:TATA box-binding protein-associated factor, RNA polymerase III, subunit 2 [Dictyostelium discoideum AX4]|uniref:B-related factor 1 n=1 Tax=Dictyostelium discoideum TaxID=44689 RepID=Q54U85_DICDI|nr:TATA box-binding protein-associated factor, RNA polymerase III, subunit 2 [Dictyostelium discoideum AX4]EAL66904.1 TATA box-binding protein-associated factor, RNA polymerase III, subunit 2 [Dictyostelium discoideum AX4]|eukprot:XP_640891.1 TATA box-binding protein-associated factor, RNA polymerase III, subunit 2 [Dictyostelium discoideum AX4]